MSAGMMASAVHIAGGVVFSDDFNRADGAPGANWVAVNGSYLTASNRLASQGGDDHWDWVTAMPSVDHWIEADVAAANFNYVVIHARASSGRASFYMGFLVPGGGLTIAKTVGGSYSDISNIALSHGDAHKLRLELEGSAQRLYVDGVLQLTTGDTALATGTAVGVNSNGPPAMLDNFRCGPLPYTPP